MSQKEPNPQPLKLVSTVRKHLALLGLPVRDRVTGFRGVVTSVVFDLYGCVQACVVPEVSKDNRMQEVHWYDVSRLEIKKNTPVMEQPNFEFSLNIEAQIAEGKKGPAEKPAPRG